MASTKVLHPSGILDGVSANNLHIEIIGHIQEGASTVVLDFQEVSLINSSGVGALVAALKAVRIAKKQLVVCSLSPQVAEMFRLTKIDKLFKVFPDLKTCENSFNLTSV